MRTFDLTTNELVSHDKEGERIFSSNVSSLIQSKTHLNILYNI